MNRWMIIILFSLGLQEANAFAPTQLEKIRDQFSSPRHHLAIRKIPAQWVLENQNQEENLIAHFRNQDLPDLILSIRVDDLDRFPSESPNLKKYVSYYTKKYPRAGLQILNDPMKSIMNNNYAYIFSRYENQDLQSRQSILWHPKKKVFIFTCSSKIKNQSKANQLCDEMISKLHWQ